MTKILMQIPGCMLASRVPVKQRVQRVVCMQVIEHHNVCAWMHAGERASQCVRMDAVDEQCQSD